MTNHDIEVDRLAFFWRMAFKHRGDGYPDILDWTPISGDSHIEAEFTIDGQRYAVVWEYDRYGGDDRAYWDDRWWPKFFAVVQKRRGLVPWRRLTRMPIYWASGERTLEGQLQEIAA